MPSQPIKSTRILWIAVVLLGVAVVYVGLGQHAPGWARYALNSDKYQTQTTVMHTVTHVTIVPSTRLQVSPAAAAKLAFDAMREVERHMNAFDPQSDIGRLNDSPAGTLVSVDPLTWRVMMEALRFHRLTDGAFDVTVGPLMAVYKYENGPVSAMPPAHVIEAARKRVGSDKILYEREGMKLGFRVDGMRVDLGAIAKGFAADHAMEALQRVGVENALVEIGGELRLIGTVPIEPTAVQELGSKPGPSGQAEETTEGRRPWRTGIRNPRKPLLLAAELERTNCAIATSGDYEKYFEFEGKRYSHIVDPRTGRPLQGGVVSATVVHPTSCLRADALATAFSVMGVERTKAFLRASGADLGLESGLVILYVLKPDGSLEEVRLSGKGAP